MDPFYKSLDAAALGALPLPAVVARPSVAFGPIFVPPGRPAEASAGSGAGLGALGIGTAAINCGIC